MTLPLIMIFIGGLLVGVSLNGLVTAWRQETRQKASKSREMGNYQRPGVRIPRPKS